MRVTVLGKSPAWQDAGGACSGYLVEEAGTTLLLDCGNGVFSRLRTVHDYLAVDAIVVSHLHADHFLDLIPYAYALTYAPRQQTEPVAGCSGTDTPVRPRLFAPRGAAEVFRRIAGTWGGEHLVERAFEITEYGPRDQLDLGAVSITLSPVPHYVPTCAMDVRSAGARFTYGADCAPNGQLVDVAGGTGLLIAEATLPCPERGGERGHLTPGEAGEHAARAGAAQLVLTHISDELDSDWAQAEAQRTFDGPVTVAREGAVYEL